VLLRVKREFAPINKTLEELASRPAGVSYRGVWTSTATYAKDQAVTESGSLWVALGPSTGMKPGSSPGAWQLAVKRGADGKDYREP
jgi:hypothetical protein